eukprot:s106_g26.t1
MAETRAAGHAGEGHIGSAALETREHADPGREETTVSRPNLGTETRPGGDDSDYVSLTTSPPSPRRVRTITGPEMGQPHQAERTLAVEYSYETAEAILVFVGLQG